MRKLIQVTQEDLDNGKTGDPTCCPVALAASRVFGTEMHVNYKVIHSPTYLIGSYTEAKIPPEIASLIHLIDEKKESVNPFSFEVESEIIDE